MTNDNHILRLGAGAILALLLVAGAPARRPWRGGFGAGRAESGGRPAGI